MLLPLFDHRRRRAGRLPPSPAPFPSFLLAPESFDPLAAVLTSGVVTLAAWEGLLSLAGLLLPEGGVNPPQAFAELEAFSDASMGTIRTCRGGWWVCRGRKGGGE